MTELNSFINRHLDREGDAESAFMAVANIDSRIKYHFGNAYGLTYAKSIFGGVKAEILLPKEYEAKEPIY